MDNLWEKVCDLTENLMFICDADGIITDINKHVSDSLDYSKEELIGKNLDVVFLDKNFSVSKAFEESKQKKQKFEVSVYKKNKTCFQVALWVAFNDENGKYIVVAEDRTKELQAQKEIEFVKEQAREAGKIRDEFVANVTHELRTPVNGIKGHAQYMMMTDLTKDQKKEMDIIIECCLNMEKLINNILDFSKLESGKFSINEKEFVFADFIKYVTETNGKLIEDKGLRFIVNVDDSIPERLIGDDFRLTQILNNLLSNALKFTKKGYIAVEATRSMQVDRDIEIFFMVMDTGIGIPDDKKDKLFESFTQVDASISRTYGGTGLGLAITKQLVNLMNGNIRLESEYGKGSSFTFTVRMKIPEDVTIETKEEEAVPVIKIEHSQMQRSLLEETDRINQFGTEENKEEFERVTEKLGLCLELENYEKSEQIADTVKSLVLDGPPELKNLAFRMQMMIRKEDGEHAKEYLNQLIETFEKI